MTDSRNIGQYSRFHSNPAGSGLVDGVDFPHSGLLKALSVGLQNSYAILNGTTADATKNFSIVQTNSSGNTQFVVRAGTVIRDGKLMPEIATATFTQGTPSTFDEPTSGNAYFALVVTSDSTNVLAIRGDKATTDVVPQLTAGDIPVAVIKLDKSGTVDSRAIQYLTTAKSENSLTVGYDAGSTTYTETMSIIGDASRMTFQNKIADADIRFVLADNTADEKFEIVTDDDADGDLTDTLTEAFSVDGTGVTKVKSLSLGTAAELTITESSDDITIKNTVSNKDINFNVNDGGSDTEVIKIDGELSSVRIGQSAAVATDGPDAKLDVRGTNDNSISIMGSGSLSIENSAEQISPSSRAFAFLSIDNGRSMVGGNIRLDDSVSGGTHDGYASGTDLRGGAGIIFTNTSANDDGEIQFVRQNDSNDDTWTVKESMRIDASGNVGVGTASPDANAKLSVEGAISLDEISAPTSTGNRGQLYANADNELHMVDGAGVDTIFLKGGKHSIWVPAEAISPRSNAGCADLATTAAASNGRPDIRALAFDKTSTENGQFTIAMPKMWNEGTITFQAYWTNASVTSGGVTWGLKGVSLSNDDAINADFGTIVYVDDTQTGAAKDVHITPESGPVTISGSPAANDLTFFQIERGVSESNDTLNEDALLMGIKIFYTIDSGNDA